MAAGILGWTFIGGRVVDGPLTRSPEAGAWVDLDVAWGPAPTDRAGVYAAALSVPSGVDIDLTYAEVYTGHRAPVSGYTEIDTGWSPQNYPVYLDPARAQCAAGFWRLRFAAPGTFVLSLADVGEISVTVLLAAAAPTEPIWTLVHPAPMGRGPAKAGILSFDGAYPEGGLDVPDELVGGQGIFFADVTCRPPLLFAWERGKLHVYDAAGEIDAGVDVSFTTTALFIGGGL